MTKQYTDAPFRELMNFDRPGVCSVGIIEGADGEIQIHVVTEFGYEPKVIYDNFNPSNGRSLIEIEVSPEHDDDEV